MDSLFDGHIFAPVDDLFLSRRSRPSSDVLKTVVIVASECCLDFRCLSMSEGIPFEIV